MVREMLADDESSDDDLDMSMGKKIKSPLPIDIYMNELNKANPIPHYGNMKLKRYSDAVKITAPVRESYACPREMGMNDENQLRCSYCHKGRHTYENCRRRLGLCLICGSDRHMIKDCPHHKKNQNTVVGASLNGFKCGKPGHVQRNCTQTTECNFVTVDTFSAWTSDFM